MKLLEKLFCKHKWATHSKQTFSYRRFVPNILGDGYTSTDIVRDEITEILICEHCGKIKKLKY